MKKVIIIAALSAMAVASQATVVFDSMTGATLTYTGSTPRNMIGSAFNLGNTTGATTIRGMDFVFAHFSTAAVSYTNVRFDVTFFDAASLATTGTSNAFSAPLATYAWTLGAVTLAANTQYSFSSNTAGGPPAEPWLQFTPFTFSGVSNLGVQILARVDQGAGLVSSSNVTPALRHTAALGVGSYSIGTAGINGYYRNASNASPTSSATSLLGSDFRSFTAANPNEGLAMRLYTTPEPGTWAAMGLGAVAVMRRRRSSK